MSLVFPTGRDVDEWQVFVWNLPEKLLSRPQKLQFMLILDAAFNEFDPFLVVPDLLQNRDLWHGILMDRCHVIPQSMSAHYHRMSTDLIKLRDLEDGYWNVDSIFILTNLGDDEKWKAMAERWNADEVEFIEGRDVSDLLGSSDAENQFKILTVWWD